jgi:hypothetical protein
MTAALPGLTAAITFGARHDGKAPAPGAGGPPTCETAR